MARRRLQSRGRVRPAEAERDLAASSVCLLLSLVILAVAQPRPGNAAPIVGETQADNTIIDCNIAEDGTTSCAVVKGQASVCARRTGEIIRRSYLPYDYLPEPQGCTLDRGYWLEHGKDGPRAYDEIWDRVAADGAKAPFFNSGRSYGEIFADSESENPYDRLARAYIGAELNRLNGARTPTEVSEAIDQAVALLISQTTASAADMASEFSGLAQDLEAFVAGSSGVGLCTTEFRPLGVDDVGKPILGLASGNTGRVQTVEVGRGDGEGVIEIAPDGADDLFIIASESFAVEDQRKGKFTQTVNDCVDVETGEQTTARVGENPELPSLTTASFQDQARNLLIMLALNETPIDPAEIAPAAGPTSTAPTTPTSAPTTGSIPSKTKSSISSFPSATLPATGEASGGASATVVVPNVVGLTLTQAQTAIAAVDLTVGAVTVVSGNDATPEFGLVSVALAQDGNSIVQSQNPPAGTIVTVGSSVQLFVAQPATDLPEPSSLPLFLVALAVLLSLLWWRARSSARQP